MVVGSGNQINANLLLISAVSYDLIHQKTFTNEQFISFTALLKSGNNNTKRLTLRKILL